MKFLPWSEDDWLSESGNLLKYDKLEHFLLYFFLTLAMKFLFVLIPVWVCVVAVFWCGVLLETLDGYLTYDGVNVEGFSWKDLIANASGIALYVVLYWSLS